MSSRALRSFALLAAAFASGLIGCAYSETQFPLAVPPDQAPHVFGPITTCAGQRGLAVNPFHGGLTVLSAPLISINYFLRDGKLLMGVVITGEISAQDEKTVVAKEKARGMAIWECAKEIGFKPARATGP